MRVLIGRLLIKLRGNVSVDVFVDGEEFLSASWDEIAYLRVGRNWVTAWAVWQSHSQNRWLCTVYHVPRERVTEIRRQCP